MVQGLENNTYQLLATVVSSYFGLSISKSSLDKLENNINANSELIAMAEVHGIAPLFYEFIKQQRLDVKPEIKRQFQSLAVRHKHAAEIRTKVLTELIDCFKQNNIRFVLLKGVALANMIYSKPEFRPMRDIDILISETQQVKARKILEQIGFSFDKSYASVFMGDIHHLPNAVRHVDGLQISLEVHHQVFSRDVEGSQNFEQIIEQAQMVTISEETRALALDHISMLNHLCRHTFSLAPEVRLIHQFDILKYAKNYLDEIPWEKLNQENHFIINTIRCLHYSIYLPEAVRQKFKGSEMQYLTGIGEAMLPYTHILANKKTFTSCFKALFSPSSWWMHVNYNIPPENTLFWCYLYRHPKRVVKDISLRLYQALRNMINGSS